MACAWIIYSLSNSSKSMSGKPNNVLSYFPTKYFSSSIFPITLRGIKPWYFAIFYIMSLPHEIVSLVIKILIIKFFCRFYLISTLVIIALLEVKYRCYLSNSSCCEIYSISINLLLQCSGRFGLHSRLP